MSNDIFEKYSKEKEPTKYYKTYAWKTAIGLQKVDGLEPSKYLIQTAEQNINGDISFDDAHALIHSYYKESKIKSERAEEADKVSVRIAQIISEKSFVFSPIEYTTIHKRLFDGIYSHAGKIRDYNISKEEWVLDGDTVIYGNAFNLRETLEYDTDRRMTRITRICYLVLASHKIKIDRKFLRAQTKIKYPIMYGKIIFTRFLLLTVE